MKFGFCIMSDIDEIGFFNFIENLGYDSAWVADSQMMYSDVYVVCAMAARETKRLRIGPGTAICGTRIPPVRAGACAARGSEERARHNRFPQRDIDERGGAATRGGGGLRSS